MKIRLLLIAAAFAMPVLAEDKPATPAPPTPPPAAVLPDGVLAPTDLVKLKEMVGKPVIVEGTLTAQGENKTATIRYLNFSKNYKESIALVFVVDKGADQFTAEKLAAFVGKKVRVSGTVGTYNDTLQIKIDKLDQIKILP